MNTCMETIWETWIKNRFHFYVEKNPNYRNEKDGMKLSHLCAVFICKILVLISILQKPIHIFSFILFTLPLFYLLNEMHFRNFFSLFPIGTFSQIPALRTS